MNNHKYALVIVDIPKLDTRTFSYLIPDEFRKNIAIGSPVLVPFGYKKKLDGYVVGFSNYLIEGVKAKSITRVLDEPVFDLEYLNFLNWLSEYYCTNLPTVLSASLPEKFFRNKVNPKLEKYVAYKNSTTENKRHLKILEHLNPKSSLRGEQSSTKQSTYDNDRLLRRCTPRNDSYRLIDFIQKAKTTHATLKKLAELGHIEIIEKKVYRNALSHFENEEREDFFALNEEQKEAYETIVNNDDNEPFLLFGVTGSGKSEVYFHLMRKTIEEGKNVLFLAPEITIATELARRISKRFGAENVAIWHSSVSDGEKYDVWQRLRDNDIKIICGARSAVFAPLQDIGLIVIDEEHEGSYKQTNPNPRYDARTVAIELAKRNNAVLVMGSATPDITSYYKALNSDKLLALNKRFGGAKLAKSAVIDLKDEFLAKNHTFFSKPLKFAIEKNLREKKQTVLLINRRGFSTSAQCLECGETVECPKCSIPLIFHKTNDSLRCHWCNFERANSSICPSCKNDGIKYVGVGTQKIELTAKKIFPDANIARIDSDVMSRKNDHINIMKNFHNGEIDILIGTQMIAKGLDNPNVTLVGVIFADGSFNLPDFRASERGFQLITQVSGRAGRGEHSGIVYIQTFSPNFAPLQNSKNQDYISFYEREIVDRDELSYPPFSQLFRMVVSSETKTKAEKFALGLAIKLNEIADSMGIAERFEVLGPAPCVIARLKDLHRFQIIIKNRLGQKGHSILSTFVKNIKITKDIRFTVDVDPVDML